MEIRNNNVYSPVFASKLRPELLDDLVEAGKNKLVHNDAYKKARTQELDKLEQQYNNLKDNATEKIKNGIKDSPMKQKIESCLEKYFKFVMKLGRPEKTIQKNANGSGFDLSKAVISAVLWGNVGKEVVGTALYTTQAMTNPDLPKEKRKFVGLYDLFVGIVSTTVSFIFGVGLQKTIKSSYEKALKPLNGIAKYSAIIAGLSGFTSFALQTIVGKRIIAPAIGTPLAGRYKEYLMAKDAAKKAKNAETPQPVEDLPTNKAGFVDLNSYLKQTVKK